MLLKTIPQHPKLIVLTDPDNGEVSTGAKRNALVQRAVDAGAEYSCFIDDDDRIEPNYVGEMMKALEQNPDTIGFKGWVTFDGTNRHEWRISKNMPYQKVGRIYFRHTNHLCPIKTEIAIQVKYPDKTIGEDYDYAIALKKSGLVKTEVFINKFLYHYDYKSKK